MRVKELPREAEQRRRQEAEYAVEPAFSAIYVGNEISFLEVVSVILNTLLGGSEAEFESSQAFVRQGCPAQMQARKSDTGISLDRFPHHAVVGPQPLEGKIRGTEFVNNLRTVMKKHRGGQWPAVQPGGHNQSMTAVQHVAGDVFKEAERL